MKFSEYIKKLLEESRKEKPEVVQIRDFMEVR